MTPTSASDDARPAYDWRRSLRRNIGWLLLLKLVALILLKNLFFSSEQRLDVTPHRVDSQLALDTRLPAPIPPRPESPHD